MDINTEDFRSHFELLSDETLLGTKRDDLVDAAKAVYDQELTRRGLNQAEVTGEVLTEEGAEHHGEEEHGGLVSVGSFTDVEEARLARGLLQGAEIPCGLVNDKQTLGVLHLMVPENHLEAAMEVLGEEISEEELAAQAEAAGFEE